MISTPWTICACVEAIARLILQRLNYTYAITSKIYEGHCAIGFFLGTVDVEFPQWLCICEPVPKERSFYFLDKNYFYQEDAFGLF